MLKQYVSSPSSAGSDADIAAFALPRSEPLPQDDPSEITEDAGATAQTVRDQLAREVADIEAATAALRRAEPALESWTKAPASTGGKTRPVWLLIGVLWLSTALVTAGAVVAIASLAG
jgi:predicted transcriptional regulator